MEEKANSKFAPLLENESSLDKGSFNNLLNELLNIILKQDVTENDLADDNDPFWGQLIEKVSEIIPLEPTNQPSTKQYACKIVASLLTLLHPDQVILCDDKLNHKKDTLEALQIIYRLSLLMLIGHPITSDMFPTLVKSSPVKHNDRAKLFRVIINNNQRHENHLAKRFYILIDVIGFNLLHLAALRGECEVIATLAKQARYPQMLASISPQGTSVTIAIRKGVKDKAFNDIALQLMQITDKTEHNAQLSLMRNNALLACDRTRQNKDNKLHYLSAIEVAVKTNSDLTPTLLEHCIFNRRIFKLAIALGYLRQVKWIHKAALEGYCGNLADEDALNFAKGKNQKEIVEFLHSQSNEHNNNNDDEEAFFGPTLTPQGHSENSE